MTDAQGVEGRAVVHEASVWAQNPHLEAELRRLVAKGVSAASIARSLKVGRGAVIGKATRLGLRLKGGPGGGKRPLRKPGPMPTVETREYDQPSPPRRFSWQEPLDVQ